ncbi:HAD family hydrolase [Floccifex sp.]|uniref:HAD family hydrolase n=1 Tax=Floccifex sp. TaxID=2815810 RepID=UPI002A765171|nr:HAD family hydrolase [Floccifex sp.]MDD7281077.1 HAD family hydrolase [Erysipelotrichaceae bacterium]MDY2958349.1 HAD family hydrolase [Floccifex sp.]
MIKNTVTLVATDLDGTLLNAKKEVSEENKQAIRDLKKNGIFFGIASGRPVETILKTIEDWGLNKDIGFVMGMNGGAIYDYRQQIKEDFYLMDGKDAIDIMDFFQGYDVIFWVLIGDKRYVNISTPQTREHAKLYRENEIECDLYDFVKDKKINKLILHFDPSYQKIVENRASEYKNPNCTGFFTANNLFEFVDPHINKGFGIEKLCEHFGTSKEHVVSFGDDLNDCEMLMASGCGVAMKNARNRLKAVANYVSEYTNEENAIAHFVYDYILKEEEHV